MTCFHFHFSFDDFTRHDTNTIELSPRAGVQMHGIDADIYHDGDNMR